MTPRGAAEHTMSTDWIPGAAVGVVSGFLSWLLGWRINSAKGDAQSEERLSGMQADIREIRDDFKAGMIEVRSFADLAARLQSSQNVVNQVTAKSLESICEKQERIESTVADHTATLRLLTEVVMTKKDPK
jgi:hypothetical protein